ncbi:TPA: RNA methyltransferase [Methanopyrus kandleri]|uniref:rRNA methylase n=2 Tax=Methanopyrus kandleri TaxID=2320 RepID=Q8TXY9_METKA|nr:rRNA methylase [Methanopyrus kandleri AV19]HII70321.1 RNA methyltransferase [Methanopyrus kandleri]
MDVRVVLVEPKYDGNIGHVARVMKNFGVKELFLVRPRSELGEVAIARAMHALDLLENAVIVNTLEEAIEDVEAAIATTAVLASTPARNPMMPWEVREAFSDYEKIAVVFGPEDRGLRTWEVELCDATLHIPTSEEYRSMNLSHSVAVVLYELKKMEYVPERYGRAATKREKEVLVKSLDDLMKALNFDSTRRENVCTTFRRFLARARCTDKEIKALLWIFEKAKRRVLGVKRRN